MDHLVTGRWGGLGASWRSGVAPRAQAVWRGHRSRGRLGRGRHGPRPGCGPLPPVSRAGREALSLRSEQEGEKRPVGGRGALASARRTTASLLRSAASGNVCVSLS